MHTKTVAMSGPIYASLRNLAIIVLSYAAIIQVTLLAISPSLASGYVIFIQRVHLGTCGNI